MSYAEAHINVLGRHEQGDFDEPVVPMLLSFCVNPVPWSREHQFFGFGIRVPDGLACQDPVDKFCGVGLVPFAVADYRSDSDESVPLAKPMDIDFFQVHHLVFLKDLRDEDRRFGNSAEVEIIIHSEFPRP
ncbi:hypothetical protein A9R04_16740 [Nocardiopsis dassonvillei]|nr:hypothetical protein A9R04_16740 [Nocardiopsis dassonvillei]